MNNNIDADILAGLKRLTPEEKERVLTVCQLLRDCPGFGEDFDRLGSNATLQAADQLIKKWKPRMEVVK